MERANLALAEYLLDRGDTVHLVGHTIDGELTGNPNARVHHVRRPAGSFLLAEVFLDRRGRQVGRSVSAEHPGTIVVVNGGNCDWGDVNWVHFVHHAWRPTHERAPLWFRVKDRILNARGRSSESRVISKARVVISNSFRTRSQLIEQVGIEAGRIHNVYLGTDPDWGPPTVTERKAARDWLQLPAGIPVVAFVGALGYDRRKGFDVLLEAWAQLAASGRWPGRLVAAGGGRGLQSWRGRVEASGISDSVRLLGFTDRVPDLLAAADLLVSPVRYESYGLNVQEAICRGVPAMVSRNAGIAERYPAGLGDLLLDDPTDSKELARKLAAWSSDIEGWRQRVQAFSTELRSREWRTTAAELAAIAEEPAAACRVPPHPNVIEPIETVNDQK